MFNTIQGVGEGYAFLRLCKGDILHMYGQEGLYTHTLTLTLSDINDLVALLQAKLMNTLKCFTGIKTLKKALLHFRQPLHF